MVVLLFFLALVSVGCLFVIKALYSRLAEFRKSDQLKRVFIKGLSREIRTHLHSVSGMAEIISKEEKQNISSQIKYNTGLISTLLDEVAVFSDDSSDGHELSDERFLPNLLCRRSLDANRPFAHEGVKMTFRHELSESYFVSADRHIVELIMNKLVYCACKFTKNGEISVGCRCGDPAHLFTFYVEDTGGGIPIERKEHLFDWFDHPDTLTEETEFDLSVAQRLAHKVGGYLRQDDSYTKGTRIEFILPVR